MFIRVTNSFSYIGWDICPYIGKLILTAIAKSSSVIKFIKQV